MSDFLPPQRDDACKPQVTKTLFSMHKRHMKINSRDTTLTKALTLRFNSVRQALYLLLASENILPIQIQLQDWEPRKRSSCS